MTSEELSPIAEKWIKAWNDRDNAVIVSMFKDDSSFSQIGSMFNPVIVHEQKLIPNLWLHHWVAEKVGIVRDFDLSFSIEKIKSGEEFIQIRSRLSDGKFIVDYLRITEDGKIDQHYRTVDQFQYMDIVH